MSANYKWNGMFQRGNYGADTPESVYAKGKVARFLADLADYGIRFNNDFFDCFEWCVGDLRELLRMIADSLVHAREDARIIAARCNGHHGKCLNRRAYAHHIALSG
ncbi:hypothetical protein FACS1894167_11100 [Synergistales bacterium]|nr:hypothetical protein FACS1894167_11100 [Synergistales bacterium]